MASLLQFSPQVEVPLAAASTDLIVAGNTTNNAVPTTITLGGSEVTPDSLEVATAPTHGTASVVGGALVYTPASGYVGPDSFTYTGTVSGDTSTPGTITIDVQANYNCECDDTTGNATLKELRDRLMIRLGFAAQVDNPPPGMASLLNDFLQEAQRLLYRRYDVLRTERFYSWPLTAGIRMYDFAENMETCTKRMDPRKVTWVGVLRDGIWTHLECGIPPELYSNEPGGWPLRYEIRQCIEVWPMPVNTEGKLVVKGHFGLEAFSADTDKTTIDDQLVFSLALANAKAHYGRPDAGNPVQQMEAMMLDYVAGSHNTRRYIPGRDGRTDHIYVQPRMADPL